MILEAKDLSKSFSRGPQTVQALRGVTLRLERGQFAAIMGPSGSGKSTLLHLLGGLDRPTQGSIRINDRELSGLSDRELSAFRRQRLGFIFQFFNLLPTLSAIENVALPQLLDGKPLAEIAPRARALLESIGLGARTEHRPDQLSGGEMQRVAIARALLSEPWLLLADEPTGNLDSKTGALVLEQLQRLAREKNQTILMVTHDLKAASYADRLIRLRDGAIESDGAPDRA